MDFIQSFAFFTASILILFLIARLTLQQLYVTLSKYIRNDSVVKSIIALIYLPGTILHEATHAAMALFLLLRVKEISVFPHFEEKSILLGRVIYERKDWFRSLLVGISPLFTGIGVLYIIFSYRITIQTHFFILIGALYSIFVLSSTLFSSKEDLKDIMYTLPFIIIFIIVIYIGNIDIAAWLHIVPYNNVLILFLKNGTMYIGSSILINLVLFFILKGVTFIL